MALVDCKPLKSGNYDELFTFIDTVEHNVNSLQDTKQFDLESFLTLLLYTKLTKCLQESWLHFLRDSQEVPQVQELLKLL